MVNGALQGFYGRVCTYLTANERRHLIAVAAHVKKPAGQAFVLKIARTEPA